MLKQNQMEEGRSYRDREGTVWNCYQHSVYDEGWSWCRNANNGMPGFFDAWGQYNPGTDHDYDLVEDLGVTSAVDQAELSSNEWYVDRMADRHD